MRGTHALVVGLMGWLLCGLVTTGSAAAVELPNQVVQSLEERKTVVLCSISWQELADLPLVDRVRELAAEDEEYGHVRMMVGPLFDAVAALGLDDDQIVRVWILGAPIGLSPGALWIETNLDDGRLDEALGEAGWSTPDDDSPLLRRGSDQELTVDDLFTGVPAEHREEILGQMSDEDIAELLDATRREGLTILRLGNGWLVVGSGYVQPPVGDVGGFISGDQLELGFPFEALVEPDSPALLAVAIDVPGNDGPFLESWLEVVDAGNPVEDGEDVSEMERLTRRLGQLQNAPHRLRQSQVADFLLEVRRSDGGLRLDLTGRRPGGGGEELNARMLSMGLLMARFAVGAVDPQLDRELAAAWIEPRRGEVRADLVLSTATLLDALEAHAARQREIRDLRRRVEELQ